VGIVHRDVKPENVMIRGDGLVKLLDFGIAKSPARSGEGRDMSRSPTHVLTGTGVILGTASYMSPEQARGEPAGRQADIWALGCLLFEALAGRQAFPGRTAPDVLAAILTSEPPWEALPAETPWLVRSLLRRCLEKDAEARWQSAADVAETLRWLTDPGASDSGAAGVPTAPTRPLRAARGRSRERLAWAAALALVTLALGFSWWRARDSVRGPLHLALPLPKANVRSDWFQLSPDGGQLAWVGRSRDGISSLWVRRLAERDERQLTGTEGAIQPFWSADGRWLGFFADGKLQKVPAAGGPPQVLAPAPSPYGGAWSPRGVIVFAPDVHGRLYRVSAEGGEVTPVTEVAPEEEAHRWPCFLSDGDHFAFLGDSAQTEHHQIRLGSLAGGPAPRLVQAVSAPVCLPGYLLYVRAGTLLAHRFDAGSARLVGEPAALAENLGENTENHHFEVTATPGLLAYRSVDPATQFVWIDRRGRTVRRVGEPGRYGPFDLSRDERHLAFVRYDADGRFEDVWWHDLRRGIVARVAASGGKGLVGYPVWSPDAAQLALGVSTTGPFSIGMVRLGDTAPPRALLQTAVDDLPASWSLDGRFLAFVRSEPMQDANDIWVASLADGRVARFTHDPGNEVFPSFSPDGRWIAYAADPSGRREVYLRRFPEGVPVIQVSRAGGGLPAWRGDGRELYYVSRDRELVAVPLAGPAADLAPGEPEVLVELEAGDHPRVWWEGVAPARDGSRFLVLEHASSPAREPLRLVVGWQPP
jgi:Tol biopolymer transport system component